MKDIRVLQEVHYFVSSAAKIKGKQTRAGFHFILW